MKISEKSWFVMCVCSVAMLGGGNAVAQSEMEDMAMLYGDKSFISIATGSVQPISRAPSVATVVTSEDIAAIGANDLDEILETVPGLHVSRSPIGYNPIYTIRGIATQFNPQVLMLINGIPITGAYVGNRSQIWGGMPVENIARIEVIRGPGSALYGADAFSGVINIITKKSTHIEGVQAGARVGSFSTRDIWAQYGKTVGDFKISAYVRGGHTAGYKGIIDADALTPSPYPSYAPGALNLGRDAIDGRLDISNDKWQLRAGYQRRFNAETGAGVASALDPVGTNYGERINVDLTHRVENFVPDLDVTTQFSYLHLVEKSDLMLFPPDYVDPDSGTIYPNGVIGNPYKWERHFRFNLATTYSGINDHKFRLGTGTQMDDMYRIRNFADPANVVDVTDTFPFMTPHNRRISFVYAQDEWNFTQDWYLTAGVRQDRYSDFGQTTNPRVALVWETAYNLTSKLLYGKAFRPPSFAELYNINNPVATGNPNLKPETNETVELAFDWQAANDLHANLSLFRYQMKDILRFAPNGAPSPLVAQNTGSQQGSGGEVELVWDASADLRLSGSYAYQRSIDESTNQDAGNAPRHHVYARADWHFLHQWNLNTQLNYVAGREREPDDLRPRIADYHTVDLTLRNRSPESDLSYAFSVRNLFDADAREPSPKPGLIPDDLPLAPREWRVELNYKL